MKHHETLVIRCDNARCEDVSTQCDDVGDRVDFPAISAWTFRRYRRGLSGDIGDCGVGITPQMCNRVTNHGDVSTFSKPGVEEDVIIGDTCQSFLHFLDSLQ